MPSSSRRTFLATSSAALAGLSLGWPRLADASMWASRSSRAMPVSAFFPELVDPDTLRAVARTAVEAAQRAGATYADIRVADSRRLIMTQSVPVAPFSTMDIDSLYGLRVQVDGVWGFAFGADPRADAVARAARAAVATAKGLAKVAAPASPLAPAPVATGEWATPMGIDPFSVSPDEHAALLGAFKDTAERVPDGSTGRNRLTWTGETRVFASTEGALVTQRLARVVPEIQVVVRDRLHYGETMLRVTDFVPASAGFESLLNPTLYDRIKATTEDAARLSAYPSGNGEVGRYEAVFDGAALAAVLGSTLARALEMERVLGYEADGEGTSFLSPATDVLLGKALFSPLLTVTSHRGAPHYGAAKWDDEGVTAESFPVIEKGRILNYFTTRATAMTLAPWFAKTGISPKSNGSAVAWTSALAPAGCASHLSINPGTAGAGLDTLVKNVENGILIRGVAPYYQPVTTDQQLSGGAIFPMMMFEVKKGQITRRLRNAAVQFRTTQFWKAITALGDASTVEHIIHSDWRGAYTTLPISAPAAHLGQVDLVQTGGF